MATHTTPQRPGLYYPKMSNTWWLKRPNYVRFMIREATSVFVAAFLVVLLVQLAKLGAGPGGLRGLPAGRSPPPGGSCFHLVALAFAVYHSWTWFMLTGVVQVVRVGETQVAPGLIVAGALAGWGGVSLVIFFFFRLWA